MNAIVTKIDEITDEISDLRATLAWRDGIHRKVLSAVSDDLYRKEESSSHMLEALDSADFVLRGKGSTAEIDSARKRANHLCALMVTDRAVRDCMNA